MKIKTSELTGAVGCILAVAYLAMLVYVYLVIFNP